MQFRPNQALNTGMTGAPLVTQPKAQIYPPPQPNILSTQTETNSYPFPEQGKTHMITHTSLCSRVGTWDEYVNKPAHFSFQYPAEAKLYESVDLNGYPNISLSLKPYCYTEDWWGPDRVDIVVLMNAEKLPLEDFVVDQFTSTISTDPFVLSQEMAKYSKTIIVDQITAWYVNGKITREAPHVYIPYKDLVIFIGLTETSFMPPYEQACPTTLDLFNKVVSSVKFLSL
jgi:hypothetical protein